MTLNTFSIKKNSLISHFISLTLNKYRNGLITVSRVIFYNVCLIYAVYIVENFKLLYNDNTFVFK